MSESQISGGNRPGQISELSLGDSVRQIQFGEHGQLSLIGHCLASDSELAAVASRVNQSSDLAPLTDLPGSYAGVVRTERETTVFSDLSGQFPLYYRYTDAGVRVSRSSHELAGPSPTLDRTSLAARLCLNMSYLEEGHSMFVGVHRLEGGMQLLSDGRRISTRIYDNLSAQGTDMATAAEMTWHSLTEAIQRRLEPGDISSDFSGGHDSTSLAMLAASLGGRPVHALAYYNPRYPAGDIKHARRLATLDPYIVLQEIEEGSEELPYSILSPNEIPTIYDEPYCSTDTLGLQLRHKRAVAESGGALHMVGVGGDALYDGHPSLADLIRQGELEQAMEQATILGRLSLGTPQLFFDDALRQSEISLPRAFSELAVLLHKSNNAAAFSTGWLSRPTANLEWLTPEMRRQLALRAETRAQQTAFQHTIDEHHTLAAIRTSGYIQAHVRYMYGQLSHAPFLDHRVIRAATQLSLATRAPYGQFKPLLRQALAGRGVPPEVFERTTKGNYSPVAEAGLRKATGAILALLENSQLEALGIIDPAAVRRSIEQRGLTADQYYLEPLVALEIWLRQQKQNTEGSSAELTAPATNQETVVVTHEMLEKLAQKFTINPEIAFASGPVQMLALNQQTGKPTTLNRTAITVLQTLNAGGSGKDAVQVLSEQFPGVNLSRLQMDVASAIDSCKASGLLSDALLGQPIRRILPDWPGPQLEQTPDVETFRVRPLHPVEQFKFSNQEKLLGQQVLEQAHRLRQAGLTATIAHLRKNRQILTEPATIESTQRDIVLMRQLSLEAGHESQRIACYESSLATVLMAALRGQQVTWCLGVNFQPHPVFHAWVDVNGKPTMISTDEPVEGIYQPLLNI